jgi:hypothetical protein
LEDEEGNEENLSMDTAEVVRIGAGWNWFRILTLVVVVITGFHYQCMSRYLFNNGNILYSNEYVL